MCGELGQFTSEAYSASARVQYFSVTRGAFESPSAFISRVSRNIRMINVCPSCKKGPVKAFEIKYVNVALGRFPILCKRTL